MEHKASTARSDLEQMLVDEKAEPKALPLSLLEDITGDFSDDQEIGSGGFAVVYKGILHDRVIAVKKLSDAFMDETKFHKEVECLMQVNHINVVRFLGYCADRQGNMERYNGKLVMADVHQRLLCFEYMPKGSLDKYIIDAHREWGVCYTIIKGICEGLQYLHENHIVHLDLKPANILLNNNMTPKITDFGLSRCFDENQSRDITKTITGTMGYMAPELREGGIITCSADLYSLGVIIIEILTGQKGYQAIEDVLLSWIDRLDKSQQNTLCEQIQVCYEIALECRDFNPKKRPASARDIIDRLHEMEAIQERRKSAIGILEVSIIGARNLLSMQPYCVAKYGEKWVRTSTQFNTIQPQWKERHTWDVFDLCTVIVVAVFDGVHEANHKQLGKVRIRLATLETGRMYTHHYPLMALSPSGLTMMGELELGISFTCKSWAKMLAMYGKPLLDNMHHAKPILALQQDYFRFQAVQMVAARLSRADPPLRREVVEYILDPDSHMFSLRRSQANFYRLTSLVSSVIAVGNWLDGLCNWKNPLTTALFHVVFVILVCYADWGLILPTVFLCLVMIGAWNYLSRPRNPPHIDTVLSHAELAHPHDLDEEFDMLPPPYMDTVLWYPDQAHPDELNEKLNTSKPDDIVRRRYDRLRSVAGNLQMVVGNLALLAERAESLLSWSDPKMTSIFLTLSLVLAVILYMTPFRVVAMVMGIYFLRPPWIRSRTNLLFNFYTRLPFKDETLCVLEGTNFLSFPTLHDSGSIYKLFDNWVLHFWYQVS